MKMKNVLVVSSLFFILGTLGNVARAETWSVTEGADNEWVGQWKRQGNTDRFSCEQRSSGGSFLTATVIVTESGQKVSAQKINTSDRNDCNYSGTRNGNVVEGTYFCRSGGPYKWSARISSI